MEAKSDTHDIELDALFSAIDEGFWDWRPQDDTVYFSPQCYTMLGYEPEATGLNLWQFIHADDGDDHYRGDALHYIDRKGVYRRELRVCHANGQYQWILTRGKVLESDAEGRPLRIVGTHTHIQRQKELELSLRYANQALEEERAQMQSYLNTVQTIMVALDTTGRIEMINKAGCTLLQYKEFELLRKCWFDIAIPPGEATEVSLVFQKMMRGDIEHVDYFENHVVDRFGKQYLIAWHNTQLLDNTGRAIGVIASGEDITERRHNEREREEQRLALQEISNLLARSSEAARIGWWQLNLITNEVSWSAMTCEIHGCKPGFAPQLEQAVNFYKEGWSRNRIVQAFDECVNTGKAYDEELIIITADGRERWVRAIGLMDTSDPEVPRTYGLFQDIDALKRNRQALQDTAQRLELATNSARIGVWDWDIQRDALVWDEWMYRIYGILPEEFLGQRQDWIKRLHPEDQDLATQAAQKALESDVPFDCEFRVIRPDGDTRYVKANAVTVRDGNGRAVRMTGVNFDVTSTRLFTQELEKARQTAEMANRAKSEFLATMSHEIRTPMNGVLGMLELVLRSRLDAAVRHKLQVARESGESLMNILNDILDFSKIESGKMEFEEREFIPDEIIQSCCNASRFRAEGKNLSLTLDIKPHPFRKVVGDSGRLRQIVNNLLSNAIKFTERGGIDVGCELEEDENGILMHCRVRDSGIGIAPEKSGRLFESFTQADASTTRKYGGTGLGLAICKRLCELMGGRIHVESVPQQGSTFHFTVRFGKASANTRSTIETQGTPPVNDTQNLPDDLRILVVEDNEINQMVFEDMLEDLGLSCEIADNGRIALGRLIASEQAFDMIFMDCQMPEMNGYDTTHHIREGKAGDMHRDVPIIALTANALKGDEEKCLAAGMSDYLSKPLEFDGVQRMLQKWSVKRPE